MRARRGRRLGTGVAGTVLALALAGCSDGDAQDKDASSDSSSGTTAASSPSSADSSSATATATASASATSSASASSSEAGPSQKAVASKKFTVTGTYVHSNLVMRFDLLELKRRGDLLQVVANLTNTDTDQSQDHRWQVGSTFSTGFYREDLKTTSGAFAGVVLTDVAAKKRYFVAADSGNDCVCTVDLSGTFIGSGETVELTATYAAPPESTTQMDVEVPSLGIFRDVPVT